MPPWVLGAELILDRKVFRPEPDADDEEDGTPVVVDFVRPKLVAPRRGLRPGRVD
jgi:hypothetical protein